MWVVAGILGHVTGDADIGTVRMFGGDGGVPYEPSHKVYHQ